jgi:hypothetical protein
MQTHVLRGTFGALCAGAAALGVMDGWSLMLTAWCVFGAYLMMYPMPWSGRQEAKANG